MDGLTGPLFRHSARREKKKRNNGGHIHDLKAKSQTTPYICRARTKPMVDDAAPYHSKCLSRVQTDHSESRSVFLTCLDVELISLPSENAEVRLQVISLINISQNALVTLGRILQSSDAVRPAKQFRSCIQRPTRTYKHCSQGLKPHRGERWWMELEKLGVGQASPSWGSTAAGGVEGEDGLVRRALTGGSLWRCHDRHSGSQVARAPPPSPRESTPTLDLRPYNLGVKTRTHVKGHTVIGSSSHRKSLPKRHQAMVKAARARPIHAQGVVAHRAGVTPGVSHTRVRSTQRENSRCVRICHVDVAVGQTAGEPG